MTHALRKIRSNSWENLAHYHLLTCCIVVNVIVWEIGRGKQAVGQSRAPGRVMWTKCLPRYTIQPMESTLRKSNESICKHRKLPLQVPGKVFRESGRSVTGSIVPKIENITWDIFSSYSFDALNIGFFQSTCSFIYLPGFFILRKLTQNVWYNCKCLAIINTYDKYESHASYGKQSYCQR